MIDELDACAHALEFGDMHEALGKDGLGDDAGAVHGGEHGAELGLHVGREARVGDGLKMERLSCAIR